MSAPVKHVSQWKIPLAHMFHSHDVNNFLDPSVPGWRRCPSLPVITYRQKIYALTREKKISN